MEDGEWTREVIPQLGKQVVRSMKTWPVMDDALTNGKAKRQVMAELVFKSGTTSGGMGVQIPSQPYKPAAGF